VKLTTPRGDPARQFLPPGGRYPMCTPHRARAPTRSLEACRSGVGTCVGTWCVRSPMERRGWQFTRGAPRRLLLLNKYVVSLDRFFRTPAKPSRSPPAQGRERIERLTASRARPMRAVDTFVDTAVRVPACGTAIEPTVPPTVPPGFRGGGVGNPGPRPDRKRARGSPRVGEYPGGRR